jgi:hypothetical protein
MEMHDLCRENDYLRERVSASDAIGAIAHLALSALLEPGDGVVLDLSKIAINDDLICGWAHVFKKQDGDIEFVNVAANENTPHGTKIKLEF